MEKKIIDLRNKSFEENLKKLEQIVLEMEKQEISLDKAIELYEEGLNLSIYLNDLLTKYEGKIKLLEKNFEEKKNLDISIDREIENELEEEMDNEAKKEEFVDNKTENKNNVKKSRTKAEKKVKNQINNNNVDEKAEINETKYNEKIDETKNSSIGEEENDQLFS